MDDWGSLGKERLSLPDVVRSLTDDCMIVFDGRVSSSCSAVALVVRSDMFAAVLSKVVVWRCGEFVQPGDKWME